MDLAQLKDDYGAVVKALKDDETIWPTADQMPDMQVVRIKITSESFTNREAVEKAIEAVESECAGWIRRQSAVDICPRDKDRSGGVPVAGEWMLSDTQSQQLIYDGMCWQLWTYFEYNEDATDGDLFLKRTQETILASEFFPGDYLQSRNLAAGTKSLSYAVYWGLPEDGGSGEGTRNVPATAVGRRFARFIGFNWSTKDVAP